MFADLVDIVRIRGQMFLVPHDECPWANVVTTVTRATAAYYGLAWAPSGARCGNPAEEAYYQKGWER